MNPVDEMAIERLYEDESLTNDLNDAEAGALLAWGAEQIKHGQPGPAVRRAVRKLAEVIRDHLGLTPAAAAMRLSAVGIVVREEDLVGVWALPGVAEADWVRQLLGRVQLGALREVLATPEAAAPREAPAEEKTPAPAETAAEPRETGVGAATDRAAASKAAPAGEEKKTLSPTPEAEGTAERLPRPEPVSPSRPAARVPWWQFWRRRG